MLNSSVLNIPRWISFFAGTDGPSDCNDYPLWSVGYTYQSTGHTPFEYGIVATFGVSVYKMQIAVNDNGLKTRAFLNNSWSNWV